MNTSFFVTAVIARPPLATFTIGVLVHVQHPTGSYAAAGALAAAQGIGGPALGKLVDRTAGTAACPRDAGSRVWWPGRPAGRKAAPAPARPVELTRGREV
jgi:hypothetical protein